MLYTINKAKGKPRKALEMYELYVATRDSTVNEENHRALVEQEYKYNYEKQSLQDSLEYVQITAIKDAQLAKQPNIINFKLSWFSYC